MIDGLCHIYHENTALQAAALEGVSLSIEKGSWTSFIGHTGSGKSTLAQHLNAILRPTRGSVSIDGVEVPPDGVRTKVDLRAVRRRVGLVFQYPEQQLFEETVRDELAYAPRNWGMREDEIRARSLEALGAVGLDESYMERNPFSLSGGEKRRVAIASVLTTKPEYLVLDEPTAGIDGRGRALLLSLLDRIHRNGTTVVLITHDLEIAFSRSDKILVLERGRSVGFGTADEVARMLHASPVPGLVVPDVMSAALVMRDKGLRVPLTCDPEKLAAALLRERRRRS